MGGTPRLVLSTDSYAYLRDRICAHEGFAPGETESRSFPDGEQYRRIVTPLVDRDVVLVGGTISDLDTLAVLDLAYTAVTEGARSLTLVAPYLGYSTMERSSAPGEVVTARTRAQLVSAIPAAPGGNRLVLLDVHTDGQPGFFSAHWRPVHLHARRVLLERIRKLGGDSFVLGSADAGGVKAVDSLAQELGVETAYVFKRRLDPRRTQVTSVAAHVEGRRVVIYDDMIRTGSSLLGAAQAYADAGASEVAAVATHGVLPGDTIDRLQQSKLLVGIACTDSHPRAVALADQPFLTVDSVATLLAEAIRAL